MTLLSRGAARGFLVESCVQVDGQTEITLYIFHTQYQRNNMDFFRGVMITCGSTFPIDSQSSASRARASAGRWTLGREFWREPPTT